ncbi:MULTISPECIES: copper resistance CopC/CopD family protein [Streptomyces]|uniref:copper resistance CopC/CopD family protein n=1 Tax=Streptomyces TaxID=1883 RepID=UPI001677A304|nr:MULTISPECIES: copper resistance protein CopC [Streptomyces]MBD3575919.1 copper resistance protein CopC/CopD [Streptomyces sp. KD18]GGS81828.1 transport integral membrane protein [Streptomyces toxytricini]
MHTGSPPARTPLAVLALVAAVAALLFGGAGPASAHSGLTGSDPADGSVLASAPPHVTLTFTETVGLSEDSVRVLSPDNERVNPRPAQHADGKANTGRVQLADGLAQGTYTVAWRVVSADGHPISGAFVFSVGKPSETAAEVPDTAAGDTAAGRLHGVFRHVAYSGLALLVGAAAFVLVCLPGAGALRPVRRLLAAGWAALAVSTAALLLLRGPYETGGPLTAAFDPAVLGRTVTGKAGGALVVRLLLLGAAAVLLRRAARRAAAPDGREEEWSPGRRVRWAAAGLAAGLALTWAAAEHAAAGIQVPLAVAASVLHLLAMGVWLGGLVTLAAVLGSRGAGGPSVPASAVGRFSALASAAVAVLAATGLYQSWRQVGSWEALTTTSFGRTLLVKTAAVILMLWAASFSRRLAGRVLAAVGTAGTTGADAGAEPVREPALAGAGKAAAGPAHGPGAAAAGVEADPPAPGGADGQRRHLRRTVAAEAALGVLVLTVTTVLTGTQPGRAAVKSAEAAAARGPQVRVVTVPFDTGTAGHRGTVQITLSPGRVGENSVEAVVFTEDGGLAAVPEIRLNLTQTELDIGPVDAKLTDRKGYWAAYDLRLPVPGEWTAAVTVRTGDIDQATVRAPVPVTGRPK